MVGSSAEFSSVPRSIEEPEVRRWLHDKYERLAAEEGALATTRTQYYAAIGTVLITGLVLSLDYFRTSPQLLVLIGTFLAVLGILISFTWLILLHRTLDAQALWREAAQQLERLAPPIEGELLAPVTLGARGHLDVNLLRPFVLHARRFSSDRTTGWIDRVRPNTLSQILPIFFLVVWCSVLATLWIFVGF